MSTRIGLIGLDSSHAEDFLRHFNVEGRHSGVRITSIYDGDSERLGELCAFAPDVNAVPSTAVLVESVDAVIVGHRHGALHRASALASLRAGRPTFVDKPLANSPADAIDIVMTANELGVPLLSGSALRWQAETARLKARLAGIDEDFELLAYGTWYPQSEYGGAIFYAIHAIELVQELLGTDWMKLKVRSGAATRAEFRSGGRAVAVELRPLDASGSSVFGVEVRSRRASFTQPLLLNEDYMAPVAAKIAQMLATGISSLSSEQMLAPIRLMHEIEGLLAPAS